MEDLLDAALLSRLVTCQVQASPEDVGVGLLSVPEENELPVTSPSRMEAGILKLFMTLFKVEHGEEPMSSDATISKCLLLFELSRSAPREGFRSWSSKALLTDELSAIMDSHLSKDGFCELVVRSNGHVEDAKEWFDALCPPSSPTAVLTPAALTQQAISWPRLPGALDAMDGWQPAELVVRLAALWGDLTAAFGLPARDAAGEEDATWPVALRASKESVKSMARCLDGSGSPPRPRKLRRLTMRQWLRALRGKPGRLLLGEMEARTESERLAALPQTLDRLFPNLCDRLLVTKNLWLPGELICVRYCLSDFGYWGSGGPEPLVAGRKLILGRQPFITFLPQPEVAGLEDAMPPSCAVLSQLPSGIVWLRAPVAPPKSGDIASWHLQLFASDDGLQPVAPMSQPLLIQVMCVPPAPPSEIVLCDRSPDSLTLSWMETLQDGGLEVIHYELCLEPPDGDAVIHEATEPLITITDLKAETGYVTRVRAVNSLGSGPWSSAYRFSTGETSAPATMPAPWVVQVGISQALLRWVPPNGFRVGKYHLKAVSQKVGQEDAQSLMTCEGDQMDVLFTGLSSYTPYQFSIAASNSLGQGPWSPSTVQVFTEPDLPGQPQEVACDLWGYHLSPEMAEHASLCVTWKPPEDEGGASVLEYLVKVESLDKTAQVSEMSIASSPAWISGLFGNSWYRVSVAARNAAGLGDFVEIQAQTAVLRPQAPREPELCSADAEAVILRWSPPADDGGAPVLNYVVQVAGPHGEGDLELCVAPHVASEGFCDAWNGREGVQLPPLRGATAYTLRIRARNEAGLSEAAEVTVRTGPTVPGAPEPPRVSRRPGQLKLRWDLPEDGGSPVVEYEVRVALSGDLTILAQLCVEGREVKLAGLEPGCSYSAQLRARNCRGWSVWSRWSAPRSPTAVPGRPVAPRPLLQRTARSLLVEWDPPDSDTPLLEYEVWCGKEESFCHGLAPADGRRTRTSRTVAKISGLAPGSEYIFRVRALNLSGWSPWSAPSEVACTADTMEAQSSEIMSAVYRRFGGVGAAFRAFDRDRDGFVSRNEFMLGLSKYRSSMEQRARLFDMASHEGGPAGLSYGDFASLFGRPTPTNTSKPSHPEASRSARGLKEARRPSRGRHLRKTSPRTSCLRERALQQSSETLVPLGCGNKSASCDSSRASSPASECKRDFQSVSDTEIELKDGNCDSARRHVDCRRITSKRLPIADRRVRALSLY